MQTPSTGTPVPWKKPEHVTSLLTLGIGLMAIWTTCLTFSRNLPEVLACWESPFMKYNGHGMGSTFETCQLHPLVPTQRVEIPKGGIHQGIPKSHGLKGDSWPWCPPALCQLHILPLVWERWTEQGDHCQPPENSALQTGPHMQPVFLLSHGDFGHLPLTWMLHLHKLRGYL